MNKISNLTAKMAGAAPKGTRLYLAYGMNVNSRAMSFTYAREAVMVKGLRVVFRGCADVVVDKKATTPMVLWEIDDALERMLDAREGVDWGYYKRVLVTLSDGRSALIYMMVSKREISVPSAYYLDGILEGLFEHGLPTDVHEAAAIETLKHVSMCA